MRERGRDRVGKKDRQTKKEIKRNGENLILLCEDLMDVPF